MRHSLSVLFVLAILTSANASPLHFQVNMKAPSLHGRHPIEHAHLQLDVTWDPATLVPLGSSSTPASQSTRWPTSNSHGTVTVSDSSSIDGIYPATFSTSIYASWSYTDSHTGLYDYIWLPEIGFSVGDQSIYIFKVRAFFDAGGTLIPEPFSSDEVEWDQYPYLDIGFLTGRSQVQAGNVTGFAVAVPEPLTIALAAFPLAFLRRRK